MKESDVTSVTMRVRIGDSEIEVTGPPDYVETKIADFLKQQPKGPADQPAPASPGPAPSGRQLSPAQFFKLCNPRTDNDRTLLAAFFLEKYRNTQSSTAAEIREVIREAKVPPPRNPNDSINQNIRKGLLMTAGEKENKMAFVVTSDGEATVEEMQSKRKE
jgi:hypothetical protein